MHASFFSRPPSLTTPRPPGTGYYGMIVRCTTLASQMRRMLTLARFKQSCSSCASRFPPC